MFGSFSGDSVLSFQSLLEESENFFPTVNRLFLAIGGPIIVEETVSGAIITMELIILAVPFELRFMLVDLLGRGRFIVITENADHRAGEIFCVVNGRNRTLRR